MSNPRGNADALIPAPKGNLRGLRHGVHSKNRRAPQPRAEEIAAALREMPHLVPADAVGLEEVASLLAALEAIDAALADGKVETKGGQVRHLLTVKATLSKQLREWLREFGATPLAVRVRGSTGSAIAQRGDRSARS